jgi:pimeloyl-ACP methyl ester carboxylesterase
MTGFVLVPGAFHGGWWHDDLSQQLQREGHCCQPVTLAGLEQVPRPDQAITLDTHIDQTEAVAIGLDSEPVVLVGHSYAGSVISNVADRIPQRITRVVYLDAFVRGVGQ